MVLDVWKSVQLTAAQSILVFWFDQKSNAGVNAEKMRSEDNTANNSRKTWLMLRHWVHDSDRGRWKRKIKGKR